MPVTVGTGPLPMSRSLKLGSDARGKKCTVDVSQVRSTSGARFAHEMPHRCMQVVRMTASESLIAGGRAGGGKASGATPLQRCSAWAHGLARMPYGVSLGLQPGSLAAQAAGRGEEGLGERAPRGEQSCGRSAWRGESAHAPALNQCEMTLRRTRWRLPR